MNVGYEFTPKCLAMSLLRFPSIYELRSKYFDVQKQSSHQGKPVPTPAVPLSIYGTDCTTTINTRICAYRSFKHDEPVGIAFGEEDRFIEISTSQFGHIYQ